MPIWFALSPACLLSADRLQDLREDAQDGGGDDGASTGSSAAGTWLVPQSGASFERVSDGATAGSLARGSCTTSEGGTSCQHTLVLTSTGQGCSGCSTQTLSIEVDYLDDGQLVLDSIRLEQGSGLPLDVTLGPLDLEVVPPRPWTAGSLVDLSANLDVEDELLELTVGWQLWEEGVEFVDEQDRHWSTCTTFGYVDLDSDSINLVLTACEGVGLVQLAAQEGPAGSAKASSAYLPFARTDIFVRSDAR